MKKYMIALIKIVLFLAIVAILFEGTVPDKIKEKIAEYKAEKQTHWYDDNHKVMHALGQIDGVTYTNSKEALELSYDSGDRVYECDFQVTSDDKLVAIHYWDNYKKEYWNNTIPTEEEFLNTKIDGKYTTQSINDILQFLIDHPDTWIVTDTKAIKREEYVQQFQLMVEAAEEMECLDVLDRFIVQIYYPYMFDDIKEIYPFKEYIFTLYKIKNPGDEAGLEWYASYCKEHGINVIAMWQSWIEEHEEYKEILDSYDIALFVHTVNDEEDIANFISKDIGVYTDIQ